MQPRRVLLALFAVALIAPGVRSQSSVTTGDETPPGDRSLYLGQPVDHPEDLSGVWEAPDQHGGAVGIHLNLMTKVSDDGDPPVWVPQSWQHLNLGVFQRNGSEIVFGEEGYFGDHPRGGLATLQAGHLQLHFVSAWKDTPSVDLELVHQPDNDCWQGRFHRGSFDSIVNLCRPTPGPQAQVSPLVGTWSEGSELGSACLHIAQTGIMTFTGWSDSLEIPGQTIYGANYPGPHGLLEGYGDLAKVHLAADGTVSLELNAYSMMCCSHTFIGHFAADGKTIEEDFNPGLNQTSKARTWIKRTGNTCVDAADLPKTHPKCEPSR